MDEQMIRQKLRAFIVARSKSPKKADVTDQSLLLSEGILSSLDVVELVLFIESLRGSEIDTDAIEPEVFTSIDALYAGFFGQSP